MKVVEHFLSLGLPEEELKLAMAMAASYGHNDVIELLKANGCAHTQYRTPIVTILSVTDSTQMHPT